LALESIFEWKQKPYDPERKIPQKININSYDEMWINLLTLFRNILGSLGPGEANRVFAADIASVMSYEIENITQLIKDESGGKVRPVFYASNYRGLEKHYPNAKIRVDSTPKQKIYTALMQDSLNAFIKMQKKSESIVLFDLYLTAKEKKKTLILTNYAIDLLSHSAFSELDLIESHTGILKSRALWNTKMSNGSELARIPFNKCFLQVFGDSQTFSPLDKKLRDEVLEVADKYSWNPLTTRDRILLGISSMKNPYFRDLLKSML
jgi:hypothetical protein